MALWRMTVGPLSARSNGRFPRFPYGEDGIWGGAHLATVCQSVCWRRPSIWGPFAIRTYIPYNSPSAATHWVPLSALPPHADPTALADKMVALSTYLSRNNSSGKRRDKTKKKGAAQALSRNIHAMLGAHYGTGRGYNKQLCDTDDEEEEEEGRGGGGRDGRVSSTQTAVLHEPQKRGFGAKGCLTGAGSLGGGGGALSVRVLSRLGGR